MKKYFLATTNSLDGVLVAYVEIWFLVTWLPLVDPAALVSRGIAGNVIAIITGLALFNYVEKMAPRNFLLTTVSTYAILPVIWFSYDWLALMSGMAAKILAPSQDAFHERIMYANINPDEALRFRTLCQPIRKIGSICGGLLALYFPVPQGNIEITYIIIFIAMDFDFFVKFIAVKIGLLKF